MRAPSAWRLLVATALIAGALGCDLDVPEAPVVRVIGRDGDGWILRVVPSRAKGRVLLRDAEGTLLGSWTVPQRPSATQRRFEIELTGFVSGERVRVEQESPSGLRSPARLVRLRNLPRPGVLPYVR